MKAKPKGGANPKGRGARSRRGGLVHPPPDAAAERRRNPRGGLYLNGLTSLSDSAARSLAKFEGVRLSNGRGGLFGDLKTREFDNRHADFEILNNKI